VCELGAEATASQMRELGVEVGRYNKSRREVTGGSRGIGENPEGTISCTHGWHPECELLIVMIDAYDRGRVGTEQTSGELRGREVAELGTWTTTCAYI